MYIFQMYHYACGCDAILALAIIEKKMNFNLPDWPNEPWKCFDIPENILIMSLATFLIFFKM